MGLLWVPEPVGHTQGAAALIPADQPVPTTMIRQSSFALRRQNAQQEENETAGRTSRLSGLEDAWMR